VGAPKRAAKKQSSDSSSLVTILFVLGIIGWGFFAIDRLTESDQAAPRGSIKGRATGQDAGWRRDVRNWLTRRISSTPDSKRPVQGESLSNVPQVDRGALATDEVPVLSEPSGLKAEGSNSIYLYKLNSKGQPVLAKVERQSLAQSESLREYIESVIRGPTESEVEKDFIDSFIRKPKILSAKLADTCVLINFDNKFGAGVSHQVLRYQIKQIFRNIRQIQQVDCLKILVSGKHQAHLGADGLAIPERIDSAWLNQNL